MGAEGGTFEVVTPGFLRTSPSTVPSGPHVGFPLMLFVDQSSDWQAAEAGRCHI